MTANLMGSPQLKRDPFLLLTFYYYTMFGKSFRSTLTKLTSGVKEAANKTASAIKHKGSVVDIPDEEYESVQDIE